MNAPNPAVDVDSLTVSFPSKTVLSNLNLQVDRASIYALLSGNGTGKSTTLSVLLGFLKPTSGEGRVGGLVPAQGHGPRVGAAGYVGFSL